MQTYCLANEGSRLKSARLRRSAATARHPSPYQRLAGFTEPKLAEGERRMVNQTSVSWNRLRAWLARLDAIRLALHARPALN
jgi:hypothetical protein